MKPFVLALLVLCATNVEAQAPAKDAGLQAFATVEHVFQHARCRNCHIPGDSPLQYEQGFAHSPPVTRGPTGSGDPALPCASCHAERNPPASYGANTPPGAPHWALPPPATKMAWIGLRPAQLCAMIKDRRQNGDRDLEAMFKHVAEDELVLWGWDPGIGRAPVDVKHADFTAAFRRWVDAGAPCPTS